MRYFTILALVAVSSAAHGQRVDYNSIILPRTAKDVDFAEKLVQLAWQNSPQSEILNHETTIGTFRIKQSRRSWLDNVRITGNLNEFNLESLGGEPSPQSLFFPRYNISASLSLGAIFNDPVKTKIEKEGLQIALQNVNEQKLSLRAEVLSKYENFLGAQEIYKIRIDLLTAASDELELKKKSFARGEIKLEEYNISLERFSQVNINKIQAERDVAIARLELERLIGMKLTDIQ